MKSLKDVLFVFTRSKWHTYLKMPPPIPTILRPKANIWYHKISAGWAMSLLKSLKALVLTGITVIVDGEEHALHD